MLKKKDHPSDIRVYKGPTQRIKTSTWSLLREAGDTQGGEPFYVSLISLKMQSHPELPDAEHKSSKLSAHITVTVWVCIHKTYWSCSTSSRS